MTGQRVQRFTLRLPYLPHGSIEFLGYFIQCLLAVNHLSERTLAVTHGQQQRSGRGSGRIILHLAQKLRRQKCFVRLNDNVGEAGD